ncbi:MAG: Mu transposase C-terminal domain-containing protein [Bacteroidota bacterium]
MKDVVTKPMSANLRWSLSEAINAIPITGWEFIILFGMEEVVPVRKGVINFRIKNTYYYYTIYNADLLEKLNFNSVRIRFDPSDLSQVHLFSVEDDDYLETIKPSPRAFRTKYKRSRESRDALQIHAGGIKGIEHTARQKLDKYKKVVHDVKSKKVPIELVNPVTDPKEVIDQANLDYFMNTVDTVKILDNKKGKKSKNKKSHSKKDDKKARAAAEKYKFLKKSKV